MNMFTKAWDYVRGAFSTNNIVEARPYRTRQHLRMQLTEQGDKRRSRSMQEQSVNQQDGKDKNIYQKEKEPPEVEKVRYKLKIVEEASSQNTMEDEIIAEVRQVEQSFKELSLSEQRVTRSQTRNQLGLAPPIEAEIKQTTAVTSSASLTRNYKQDVEDYLSLKYTHQKEDLPQVSLEDYSMILGLWGDKRRYSTRTIHKTNLESVEKLTYRAMGGIEYGEWLNDDAINMYLELLEKQLKVSSGWQGKIMNSYFATTTLPKDDNKIRRFLTKQGITTFETAANPPLLVPINQSQHWYLVLLTASPPHITVMDSIRRNPYDYSKNPIFVNLQRLGRRLYGMEMTLEVLEDYPQQDNGCDCGVFLLMGARDVVGGKKRWSFQQGDIRFKRLQVALEIYHQRISGTESKNN